MGLGRQTYAAIEGKNCDTPPSIISTPTARLTIRLKRDRLVDGLIAMAAIDRKGAYKMSEKSIAQMLWLGYLWEKGR